MNREFCEEILRIGHENYPEFVDPSEHEVLNNQGGAFLTTQLEKLAQYAILDVRPIFGKQGGMWFAYQLNEKGNEIAQSADSIAAFFISLEEPDLSHLASAIIDLKDKIEKSGIDDNYRINFLDSFKEVALCYDNKCYMAAISMCGKLLEICLSLFLKERGITVHRNQMLGSLIKTLQSRTDFYIDPTLQHTAKIVTWSRNNLVHFNTKVPIPSDNQVAMVIRALMDVADRTILVK